jgi:hypothetical protein
VSGNPNGLESLAMRSKIPIERIRYVSDAGADVIESIQRGILLLMAFWSGTSWKAFISLTEVIAGLESEGLELVVIDVDGSPEVCEEVPEFKWKVHGHGEAAWIREGKILSTSGMGLNIDCFKPNTIALLQAP